MLVLCGAGMKMPVTRFGFSLMTSLFSWQFRIKVRMVKQNWHIDMLGCGNRMRAALFSPQNL